MVSRHLKQKKERKVNGERVAFCIKCSGTTGEILLKYFRTSKYQFNVLLLKIEDNII